MFVAPTAFVAEQLRRSRLAQRALALRSAAKEGLEAAKPTYIFFVPNKLSRVRTRPNVPIGTGWSVGQACSYFSEVQVTNICSN